VKEIGVNPRPVKVNLSEWVCTFLTWFPTGEMALPGNEFKSAVEDIRRGAKKS
jgi:hypothetical protein